MIAKTSETRTLKIENRTIKGFSFDAFLSANVANAVFLTTDYAPEKITFSAILYRGGKETVIASGILQPYMLESGFKDSTWDFLSAGRSVANFPVLLAVAGGVKGQDMFPGHINLDGCLNLRGDDYLELSVIVNTGTFATTMDQALSFIDFDAINGVGIEYFVPRILAKSVEPGASDVNQSLGDGVGRVTWINTDKTTLLLTDAVLTSMSISSDRLGFQDNYNTMLMKRAKMFETSLVGFDSRDQSFVLKGDEPCNNVQLRVTPVAANINAGKNWIIYRNNVVTARGIHLANATATEHAAEHAHSLGLPVNAAALDHARNVKAAAMDHKMPFNPQVMNHKRG